MKNRIEFLSDDKKVLNVIKFDKTLNPKIALPNELIMQTYHFDIRQLNFIKKDGKGITIDSGFINPKLTKNNCGVCPLRFGGCYTFKFEQALGHLNMLKSINKKYKNSQIPTLNDDITNLIFTKMQKYKINYIRFGSYGCPTNLNINLVKNLTNAVNIWTGYTHEWHNKDKFEYLNYFMASSHKDKNLFVSKLANEYGFRTFETDSNNGIECLNNTHNLTCSKCGLCSGTKGKGKTNIFISTH